jgi:uncharacterized protein YyaL (SSP411 family)
MLRRQGLLALGASLVLLAGYCSRAAGEPAAAAAQKRNAARAVASYRALQSTFYEARSALYRRCPRCRGADRFSQAWPFSQALAATVNLAGLPASGSRFGADVQRRLQGLGRYWLGSGSPPGYMAVARPPYGRGGPVFHDDNEWIGLALVQDYRLLGTAASLARAEQIFDLVVSGWDSDPGHPCPGGVFWTRAAYNRDRNTVSNAPGAELGLHLYELTGRRYYLDWAKRMYSWVDRCLRAPDGLYWDHIDLAGNVDRHTWSYNQGTMLGASVLLYRVTGDETYLRRAREIAFAALAELAERRDVEPPPFVAILFSNLLLLESASGDRSYRPAMEDYAEHVWETRRDPRSGLFVFHPGQPARLLEQAAMVRIYAGLAWDSGRLRSLAAMET